MKMFVDADSCPVLVRSVIEKAAVRRQIVTFFVANRHQPVRENKWVHFFEVGKEEGAADEYILRNASSGDLVITRDIPLAARLLELEVLVINDRGMRFTEENIQSKLSERNLMKAFYQSGLAVQGPRSYGKKELFEFANCFDRTLTELTKKDARDQT